MTELSTSASGSWLSDQADRNTRERLIAAIYDATLQPEAYGPFLAALSDYLEQYAGRISELEHFETADLSGLEADDDLVAHFDRMSALIDRAGSEAVAPSLLENVLSSPVEKFLIDRTGKIVAASPAAQAITGALPTSRNVLCNHLFAEDATVLADMISGLGQGRDMDSAVLKSADHHFIVRPVFGEGSDVPYALVEALSVAWTPRMGEALRRSFNLTTAELRIVEKLSGGASIAEIAEATDRSAGTIRNQVKSVLSKTGARGQASLVRMVVLLASALPAAPRDLTPVAGPGDVDMLALPDGRALEVRTAGSTNGRAILFMHGQLFGTEVPGPVEDMLRARNLRMICPSRPGFGRSDPFHGAPRSEPERYRQDIEVLLQHYGIDRPVLLANITGSLYAYAVAAHFGDRVAGVVCAGGVVPLIKARQFVEVAPRQRIVVYLGRFAPKLLPPLLRAGISQIKAGGEVDFLKGLYLENTRDRKVVQSPALGDLLARSVHFGVAQGYHGVFNDTCQLLRDWTPWVRAAENAGVRSIHVHGRQDPAVGLWSVEEFAARHRNVSLRVAENAGQLVYFDQPEAVLDAVADILA